MHAGLELRYFKKYNADYDLSAKEGADTLAFISLLEEKLLPALVSHGNGRVGLGERPEERSARLLSSGLALERRTIYTFWLDSKNYVDVTRRWYAENIPFPLNFFLPNRMHSQQLDRLRLVRGDAGLEAGDEVEKEVRKRHPTPPSPAARCSQTRRSPERRDWEGRGSCTHAAPAITNRGIVIAEKLLLLNIPSSLDAYVFGYLAPLVKVKLPNGKLQQHLTSLDNLRLFCTNILTLYFPAEGQAPSRKMSCQPEGSDFDNEPNKRRNQVLSVLVALGAMLGYAILTGIVSIQRVQTQEALESSPGHGHRDDDDDDDEE
ncbi:hypothetical protein JZ751_000087 [Albula glossodonta]|uniref:Metaxin-1 n=1 Tax=Albula glossodonta TaxID=121402 RepID=A0A8T2PV57_9TELE|nr:hypothetical protein JZ751_000087 [Albula glossodonta]